MLYMPAPTLYDVFAGILPIFTTFKTSDIAIDLQALTCIEMPSQQIKKAKEFIVI
jgi:hypothetical protein